jgi:predicted ATPase
MAIPEAEILEFKDGKIAPIAYLETENYQLTKSFLNNPVVYLREL